MAGNFALTRFVLLLIAAITSNYQICLAAPSPTPTTTPSPNRIVALIPSLGELASDLLGDQLDRIVGVPDGTDYPPALAKKQKIGPYHRFNVEAVAALKPDLVLSSMDGNQKDQVYHLKEIGIPVLIVKTGSFKEVAESMRAVGTALGAKAAGEKMAEQFLSGLERLKRPASELKVLLQLSDQPLVVAGGGTFLDEALTHIGAKNIYSDSSAHYPKPSLEDVIQRNPDVIIIATMGAPSNSAAATTFAASALRWKSFTTLSAVKNGHVYLMDSDLLLKPTLRLLEGIASLTQRVYGHAK